MGEFLEHAQFVADDLEWLLALPHDKFWCQVGVTSYLACCLPSPQPGCASGLLFAPQVVFDESLQKCLDSYLRLAPRGLDPAMLPASPAVAEMQKRLHRSVFMTFLRMTTHKESKVGALSHINVSFLCVLFLHSVLLQSLKWCLAACPQENFITPAVFGEIIYNNYLFDIPKILDLCVLFGKGNSQLLHRMIGRVVPLSQFV